MTIISHTTALEMLLAVVDHGGFSAAAKYLDVQVAKVSRAIAKLEKNLDCTLLNRTTRRVELTQEGILFVSEVRASLQQLSYAESRLRELKQVPAGRLTIDAASPFMLHQLVPLVAGFRQAYPLIELELISNESIIDLIEKRTDVAIRIGQLHDSNLHARLLGNSKLRLVASPAYLATLTGPVTFDSLADCSIIGFAQSPQLNIWPLNHLQFDLKPNVLASSGETMRQLCLSGNGIALLSDFMITQDLYAGRLVEVLAGEVNSPHPRERVNAVYYKNSTLSSRITAFLDYIQNKLKL
ncbi:MAG: LysR family transcriptional regulator [Paraglaciecola polaris]|uniref:LysR family transcriptional regulator n=1 Tax=Paraglaciecola polaris TaxID=222814 RepID=UPI003002F9A2